MKNKTYTILRYDRRMMGFIYEVLVDDMTGFDDFTFDHATSILPGTTVDIADLKRIFRLRNDGEWEEFQNYSNSSDSAAEEEAVVASILDDLVSDDDIDDLIVEDETTESEVTEEETNEESEGTA